MTVFCEECKFLHNCELARHEEVDSCKRGEMPMDPIQQAIKDFEELTGVSAIKFSLDFICGFMACHRIMNLTILKLNPTPQQLIKLENEWRNLKDTGRLLKC